MSGNVRQRMIVGALDLLGRKGLQSTSFAEVTQATRTPRGSIYHHFPGGKQELVLAALDAKAAQNREQIATLPRTSPHAFIQALVDVIRSGMAQDDFRSSSAVGAVIVAAENSEQLDRCSKVLEDFIDLVDHLLVESGAGPERATPFARVVVTNLMGANLVARATRRFDEFDVAAADLVTQAAALPIA